MGKVQKGLREALSFALWVSRLPRAGGAGAEGDGSGPGEEGRETVAAAEVSQRRCGRY